MTSPAFSDLGLSKLLLIGSGSIGVSMLPFWLNWMRIHHPKVEISTVLTRSAERFVSREALAGLGRGEVHHDDWPSGPVSSALHIELADWPDAVVVYPASFNYTARLALGLGDSPSMLALQCTRAPTGIALCPPPGSLEGTAMRRHVQELSARPNVRVFLPELPTDIPKHVAEFQGCAPLPTVLQSLVELLSEESHG